MCLIRYLKGIRKSDDLGEVTNFASTNLTRRQILYIEEQHRCWTKKHETLRISNCTSEPKKSLRPVKTSDIR